MITCRNDGSSFKEILWTLEGLSPTRENIRRMSKWRKEHNHQGVVFDYEVIIEVEKA